MTYEELKARQRAERHTHPQALAIRVHRSLSWLERAEQLGDDPDGQFVFLWIAFNAAYAQHIDDSYRTSEREAFRAFVQRLIDVDATCIIRRIVYNQFQNSIRLLIGNQYIFQGFWDYQNGHHCADRWSAHFASSNKLALRALKDRNTATVMSVVLSRIYTLRNQLMHGGATCGSSINRDQVRDCCTFMGKFVPTMILIMMNRIDVEWGEVIYPVITVGDTIDA
jgi:hypothetical protein